MNDKSFLTIFELNKTELYQYSYFDYAEITCLLIIVFIGTYMNINVYLYHHREIKLIEKNCELDFDQKRKNKKNAAFRIFMLNLSISDFFIMYTHGIIEAIWIFTKEWQFGNIGCKIFKYLSTSSYYINAIMVTMIGIDRLVSIYSKYTLKSHDTSSRKYYMISFSWIFGATLGIPQLFLWKTYDPYKDYTQCVTVFAIAEHLNISKVHGYPTKFIKYSYEFYHHIFVCWIPSLIILIAYILIISKIIKISIQTVDKIIPRYFYHRKLRKQNKIKNKSSVNESQSNVISLSRTDTLSEIKSSENKCPRICKAKQYFENEKLSISVKENEESIPLNEINKENSQLTIINENSTNLIRQTRKITSFKKLSFFKFETPKGSYSSNQHTIISDVSLSGSIIVISPNGTKSFYIPFWKRQWHSKIFTTSLLIIIAHFFIWLPYTAISMVRFVDEDVYNNLSSNVGRFCETLILINSIINPILYQIKKKE
uniref:G_PROTEIN_RECEP_F1_2 domain-containing protein n=1 Tax=Parastrongyloides trichosuri TaxID=131310 RepID=A0A0N4Z178_PARTI